MRIVKRQRAQGGWLVTVERVRYTRGRAALDQVFIPDADLAGVTGDAVLGVVKRALTEDPFAPFLGRDLDRVAPAPPRTEGTR